MQQCTLIMYTNQLVCAEFLKAPLGSFTVCDETLLDRRRVVADVVAAVGDDGLSVHICVVFPAPLQFLNLKE